MRAAVIAVSIFAALSGNVEAAACFRPAERAAFDMTGLKSQMMLVAVACHREDRYNEVVRRYRAQLVSADRGITAWFGRLGNSTTLHDRYITELANAQSQASLALGTGFCDGNASLFDDVLATKSPSDLAAYVSHNPFTQPVKLEDCVPAATQVTAAARPAAEFTPATSMHVPAAP